jgi:hypothetical protein
MKEVGLENLYLKRLKESTVAECSSRLPFFKQDLSLRDTFPAILILIVGFVLSLFVMAVEMPKSRKIK